MADVLRQYRKGAQVSQEGLASIFGVKKSTVCKWERRRVPAERVLDVERVTGISRHDLRPDLYPREPEAAA
jgi:DNA-binding transcriptional regulator YdaS (Cro superfamily)